MKEIDLESWPRRAHFEVFQSMELGRYDCTVSLDVTETVEWCRTHKKSFYQTVIYQVVMAMNGIENFRFRIVNDQPVLVPRVHPVFTHRKPDEDLFWLYLAELNGTLEEFYSAAESVKANQTSHFDFSAIGQRSDLTFLSCMTKLSFTGLTHTQVKKPDAGHPRATWGKFQSRHGRLQMPFNLEVHHALVDGAHVEQFVETLQKALAAPEKVA